MEPTELNRFNELYQRHLRMLKLQGKSDKTIDAYARAVRRIREYFDCCPDQLTLAQRELYFAQLVESHSWSTVKVDRNGLQFFWKHVLKRDWQWVQIVKIPKVRSLPDILTTSEVEQLIGATRKLRYRVYLLQLIRWACASQRPWPCRWAISMLSANRYISAAARAIRIVSSRCPI
jgi:integrase/recombinase XerD